MKGSINLLPPEILTEQIRKTKFFQIQAVGVVIILILAFLTSVTMALRVLQSRNISQVSAEISKTQQKITNLKSTQVAILLLKNRLEVINKYWGVPSKQSSMYQLIEKNIASPITINAISIDKEGAASFTVVVPNSIILDDLITVLTSKESNEDKISQISLESLSRGRDGVYRVSLKIQPK